jgi:hypothetical protein
VAINFVTFYRPPDTSRSQYSGPSRVSTRGETLPWLSMEILLVCPYYLHEGGRPLLLLLCNFSFCRGTMSIKGVASKPLQTIISSSTDSFDSKSPFPHLETSSHSSTLFQSSPAMYTTATLIATLLLASVRAQQVGTSTAEVGSSHIHQ